MRVRDLNLFIMALLICCGAALAVPTQQPIRIDGVITASAADATYGSPQTVVDGSLLDISTLQHAADQSAAGWVTDAGGGGSAANHPFGSACSTWIRFDFDQSYPLGSMLLWNLNQWSGSYDFTDRGLRNVSIHYTNDGVNWTLKGDYEIPESPGLGPIDPSFELDFAGADANSVVITAAESNGNWGSAYYGLSEVMFGIDGTTYDPYSKHPEEASVPKADITVSASAEYDTSANSALQTISGNALVDLNFQQVNNGGHADIG